MSLSAPPPLVRPLPPLPHAGSRRTNHPTFCTPPLDGLLTVPEMFDWQFEHSPDHPVFGYVADDGTVTTIIWAEVVKAIRRAAILIREKFGYLGPPGPVNGNKAPVIALLANSDSITYYTLFMGILYAGFTPFLISPRNSPAALAHLLDKVSVSHLLVGRDEADSRLTTDALKLMKGSQGEPCIPDSALACVFEDMYVTNGDVSDVPIFSLHRPEWTSYFCIVHSSGSTSFPKPITWTHGNAVQLARTIWYGERDLTGARLACHSIPLFHGIGVSLLTWTVSCGLVLNVFKPQHPAQRSTIENVFHETFQSGSNLLLTVPSFFEAWSEQPDRVEALARLDAVLYGGGPLRDTVGDLLASKGVPLICFFGASEFGLVSMVLPASAFREDWQYFELSSCVEAAFYPQSTDQKTCELVILSGRAFTPVVTNILHERVYAYATSDILEAHPSKAGLWKIIGRVDDQIMHSNGEKTNPVPLEHILKADPLVESCMMFGRSEFHAGMLIEPSLGNKFSPDDADQLAKYRTSIWPSVEKMNECAPKHSMLLKEMILVTSPEKPLLYTAKGQPSRQAILRLYDQEIKQLYATVDESTQVDVDGPSKWELTDILSFIQAVASSVLKINIGESDDFFQHGCDSLQATRIRNIIFGALRKSTSVDVRSIPLNFVYQNPTVLQLASFVSSLALGRNPHNEDFHRAEVLENMVRKYTGYLTSITQAALYNAPELHQGQTILLTGSTGALGSNILAHLIASPEISHVYALNRKSPLHLSLRGRQSELLKEYGLESFASLDKATMVEADLTVAGFDVADKLLLEMRQSVTHIIHVAWPVDFNMSLQSFEPHLHGLCNLINFALSSYMRHTPRLLFTSSVAVLQGTDSSTSVKEISVSPEAAVGTGYGESKWVAEKILEVAAEKTPLAPVSLRIGQLSGGVNGLWKTSEWFPSLVRSSIYLGILPDCRGDVSWIPVHDAAAVIVSLLDAPPGTLHLAHPRPITWSAVLGPLSSTLRLPVVPISEWLDRLAKSAENGSLPSNPALNLLDWFRKEFGSNSAGNKDSQPRLDLTKVLNASTCIADLNAIEDSQIGGWLRCWRKIGFIPL